MKKLQLFGIVLGILLIPSQIFASDPLGFIGCPISAGSFLSIGSRDLPNDGRVTNLQQYLIQKGFLVMPVGVSTGYFGNLTRQALASFQSSVGITPAVGYFGPITRNYINSHCGNPPTTNPVSISYVSPSSGPVGTQIWLSGSGFTSTGNSIYLDGFQTFGGVVSSDGHTITFTIPREEGFASPCLPPATSCGNNPEIIPGPLMIKVSNTNGTSNTTNFMVTDESVSSGETIIRRVGETEGSFLIRSINSNSVDGTDWPYQPVARNNDPGVPRTLHIGDNVGLGCAGISDKLTSIDYNNQTVTFTKTVGPAPYGGCPICLSGNTLIDTPSGSIAVKDLQFGMPIWTRDTADNRVIGVVIKTSKVPVPLTHQMVHLILSDGRELFASPGHPTIDNRTVGDLVSGDIYDGASIVSTQRVSYGEGATYDVLPSGGTGFYWANGVLLGSTLFLR